MTNVATNTSTEDDVPSWFPADCKPFRHNGRVIGFMFPPGFKFEWRETRGRHPRELRKEIVAATKDFDAGKFRTMHAALIANSHPDERHAVMKAYQRHMKRNERA